MSSHLVVRLKRPREPDTQPSSDPTPSQRRERDAAHASPETRLGSHSSFASVSPATPSEKIVTTVTLSATTAMLRTNSFPSSPTVSNTMTTSTDLPRHRICVRGEISKALLKSSKSNQTAAVTLADRIEEELFLLGAPTAKAQLKTILFNLNDDKNERLRAAVLDGDVSPTKLVRMTSSDLANPELKHMREKETADTIERLKVENHKVGNRTTMIRCGRCQNNDCTFYEMQTASGDEPSTKFVTCLVCRNSFKFR